MRNLRRPLAICFPLALTMALFLTGCEEPAADTPSTPAADSNEDVPEQEPTTESSESRPSQGSGY